MKNENQYQGSFSDFEEELDWHDFELRTYDPQIGRWLQQDPYDEFSSPYVGMGNDPVNLVDPNGGSVYSWIAGLFTKGAGIACPSAAGHVAKEVFKGFLTENLKLAVVGLSLLANIEVINANQDLISRSLDRNNTTLKDRYERRFKKKISDKIDKLKSKGGGEDEIRKLAHELSKKYQNRKFFRYFGAGNHNRRKKYKSKNLTGWKQIEIIEFNPYVEFEFSVDEKRTGNSDDDPDNNKEHDIGRSIEGEVTVEVEFRPYSEPDGVEIYGLDNNNSRKSLLLIERYGSNTNPGSDGKGLIKVQKTANVPKPIKLKYIVESGNLRSDKWDLKITFKAFSTKPSNLTVKSFIRGGKPL